ncbi:hypothetical protein ACR63F_003688 [Pseudomonas aeruginosa]
MNKALDLLHGLVREVERKTCCHEETHRGGAIWEICDSCGAKWADDEGGKPEFAWPESVEKAREFLATHPAVEQAGGDERAAFDAYRDRRNALLESEGHKPGSKWHVTNAHYPTWEASRAALAQPSQKCATCNGTGLIDDGEITCSEGGIPYENGPVKCVKDCPDCKAQPSPAPELERPEGVAYLFVKPDGTLSMDAVRHKPSQPAVAVMTVAQHDRIVGELRSDRDSWAEQAEQRLADWDEMRKERDAALARAAELEKELAMTRDAASKGDAARHAAGGMEMEIQELKAKLAEQAQHSAPEVFGLERYRVERTGQGFWPYCVRAGDGTRELFVGHLKQCKRVAAQLATAFEDGKFIARLPTVQAQHSVPEISGIGRDAEHPRAVVLYLRNEPSDEDMRAIQNFLRAMLAAAPGKEVGHE